MKTIIILSLLCGSLHAQCFFAGKRDGKPDTVRFQYYTDSVGLNLLIAYASGVADTFFIKETRTRWWSKKVTMPVGQNSLNGKMVLYVTHHYSRIWKRNKMVLMYPDKEVTYNEFYECNYEMDWEDEDLYEPETGD